MHNFLDLSSSNACFEPKSPTRVIGALVSTSHRAPSVIAACHVLIIEDDAIAALDVSETLKRAGATSFSFAQTEDQAVGEALERRPAVITADVVLLEGSGVAAVRRIQAELGPVPTIFITATHDQFDGHDRHCVVDKPFDSERLSTLFRSLAGLRPPPPRLA